MDVRVLHLDDCGSWRTATERLRQAVARLGSADTPINHVQVDFDAHNDQAVFGGSPTILVDGQDLFPTSTIPAGARSAGCTRPALGCRGHPPLRHWLVRTPEERVMTTMAPDTEQPADVAQCGCCGRTRPARRVTELGSTLGVFICTSCALWAARRSTRFPVVPLDPRLVVRWVRGLAPSRRAARAVAERSTLQSLGRDLQQALLTRDVIGQAKEILMERLKITPEDAFDLLRRASQQLNIKLREVARGLAETGEIGTTRTSRHTDQAERL